MVPLGQQFTCFSICKTEPESFKVIKIYIELTHLSDKPNNSKAQYHIVHPMN